MNLIRAFRGINRTLLFSTFKNEDSPYIQGQERQPKIREYFYYIDHQGMLFLDDARIKNFTSCFKEKKFLRFFFNRLKRNDTKDYRQFPYISLCGKERNYVRCDDFPYVFTHLISANLDDLDNTFLAHNHAGNLLKIKFQPAKIFMLPKTGRVYHPAPEKVNCIGLVHSKLAIEFSRYLEFEEGENNPPTHFNFKGKSYKLDKDWYYNAVKISNVVAN